VFDLQTTEIVVDDVMSCPIFRSKVHPPSGPTLALELRRSNVQVNLPGKQLVVISEG
jgi:hypothetical protein